MATTPTDLPTNARSARVQGAARRPNGAVVAVKNVFVAESSTFYTILGVTLFLVVFGVVMVLSSSSVEQYAATHDFFGAFTRQGLYAIIGIPLMLIASRFRVATWRKYARWIIVIGLLVQALVVLTPLGYSIQGNRNWIKLGTFTAQPSEILKLALVLGIGTIVYQKRNKLDDWKQILIPIGLVTAASIGLVLFGGDQGTAMVMMILVFGAMFVGGIRLRHLGIVVGAVLVLLPFVTMASSSRSSRISAWLSGCTDTSQYQDLCWQPVHGMWALASGGVFGVGLGNSKAKWSWLPEADNDYIFAIIGEELGLIGAVVVLALFVVLAISMVRIIRLSDDAFVRTVTGGVLAWIIGQALVNIGVVLGLLPVLGVPLPLISAGGSALIMTLVAIGVVLSFARELPGKAELSNRDLPRTNGALR
ncbi:cell division-specific peptidoglycan biosynthesis regulator FtsW [Curtobacterium sp. PhB130]|uniref:putative lipid II flippase FtsW n=1 Tax=Curtobacterium sp. PhB136 TaxID=2485181 RepID=UPI000F4B3873|nr:putative lipid II flippase FtsW [Curtobacterium sp. PhB136]ROP65747.1 cell division-specific peptidoglycan biosynthesis regulator FtsW [Curtobacterium sp. ZW137]ROS72280.1 cell division-specific peptidoglycan biosynthesis regulator FtsW [Curtobacterium sp. PhB130]TCK63017.1 cell division-specific peptidoglycan biosynthesis regulator FtsW [Curtobacterium sp. PhB136]